MQCPQCGLSNPSGTSLCGQCSTPLPLNDPTIKDSSRDSNTSRDADQTLATGAQGFSDPSEDVVVSQPAPAQLSPGTVLSSRYEIIRLLGQGGMGAVYQARDRELERQVALKVIRADMVASPEILKRFKQELILARQITHKNVIRIFDLGEADGIKFITMEYIEGEDLQSILRRKKKLEPAEAANIIAQVSRALEAAHAEGVIHRDLKPQNIMLDKSGRAYVMDFGIARSEMASGVTQAGVLIGTPDYMSPEQAKGLPLDARSDLFTVGIIFYEILSGRIPFESDTTMGKLWKRTSEPARPLGELDQTIPQALCDIVRKCLEIDPQKRFASAMELLQQIEIWQGPSAGTRLGVQRPAGLPAYAKWVGAGLALVLVTSGYFIRGKIGTHPLAPHTPVTLLIADFDNKTGDSVFDGTLEPMLGVAVEGASFISLYNRGQARKVGAQLQPGASLLDDRLGRLVAMREGVSVVVGGSVTRDGTMYRVSVKALDAVTGKTIASDAAKAEKKDILLQMGTLAAGIRKALGDATPESVQLTAAETFSTSSLEAAHEYALAQELLWAGKWENSITHYLRATQHDPNLGRAYAGLGMTYRNLGRGQEAEKYYQLAMQHIDAMSERERYRTRGGYYLSVKHEPAKAVEQYLALLRQYPFDEGAHTNLALAYFYLRDMSKALEQGRRDIELAPTGIIQRANVALYSLYAGDFAGAVDEAREVLKLDPSYLNAYGAIAVGQLGQGHLAEATQTYRQMETMGARGASMAATGLADLALYEGKVAEAIPILENGIAADLNNKNAEAAAAKLNVLAHADLLAHRLPQALAAADRAVGLDNEESVLFAAGQVYAEAEQPAKAMAMASRLRQNVAAEPQSYAKLLEAEVELRRGNAAQSVSLANEAQRLTDSWLARFDSGRAYLEAGSFTEAHDDLEACLKRRGEATAVFLDDVPTYRLFPPVYYYLGRAQEGLKSPAAAESYRTFIAIMEKADEGPLVADARRRLVSR